MHRRQFLAGTGLGATIFALQTRAAQLAVAARPATSVEAVTLAGKHITLSGAMVDELRTALRGPVITRTDTGYDSVRRVWNAAIDRRPALIARCLGAADVMTCVKFARSHGLLTSVRAGGHSSAGRSVCDDGLMIDLSLLRGVRVDPVARIAEVAGGSLLGDLDRESQAFGLVTTVGTVSHTGVGGLTVGGGIGRLVRRFGMTIDNLESADVVTANGSFLRVSQSENPDLFWGTRGGGGNFGIVTRFQFRLHPFGPDLVTGDLLFDHAHTRAVLLAVAEIAPQLADDEDLTPTLIATPDGRRMLSVSGSYPSIEVANRVLTPLRKIAKPLADRVGPEPYLKVQTAFDDSMRHGLFGYVKSGFFTGLNARIIDAHIAGIEDWKLPIPQGLPLLHLGGAMSRVASDATAFGYRNALYAAQIGANWQDPAQTEEILRWARALWTNVEPYTTGSYINMHSSDDSRRVVDAFGPNYSRLVELKNKYDPDNFFRLNANVTPKRADG